MANGEEHHGDNAVAADAVAAASVSMHEHLPTTPRKRQRQEKGMTLQSQQPLSLTTIQTTANNKLLLYPCEARIIDCDISNNNNNKGPRRRVCTSCVMMVHAILCHGQNMIIQSHVWEHDKLSHWLVPKRQYHWVPKTHSSSYDWQQQFYEVPKLGKTKRHMAQNAWAVANLVLDTCSKASVNSATSCTVPWPHLPFLLYKAQYTPVLAWFSTARFQTFLALRFFILNFLATYSAANVCKFCAYHWWKGWSKKGRDNVFTLLSINVCLFLLCHCCCCNWGKNNKKM